MLPGGPGNSIARVSVDRLPDPSMWLNHLLKTKQMSKSMSYPDLPNNSTSKIGEFLNVPSRCPLFKAELYELAEAELAGLPLTDEQTELKPHVETCSVCSVVYRGAIAFGVIPLPDESDNALTQLRQGFEDNPLRRLKEAAKRTSYFQSPQRHGSLADYVRWLAAETQVSDGDALIALGFVGVEGDLSVLEQPNEDSAHAAKLLGLTLDDFRQVTQPGPIIHVRRPIVIFVDEHAYANDRISVFQRSRSERVNGWAGLARACSEVGVSRAETGLCLQFQRISDHLDLPRISSESSTAARLDVPEVRCDDLSRQVEELRRMAQAAGMGIDLAECEEALNEVFGNG